MTTNTSEATKKLDQARAALSELRNENQKKIGKDRATVEWRLSACIGDIRSAFSRLKSRVAYAEFKETEKKWNASLTEEQRAFFNRMTKHRNKDVHHHDIPLSVKTSCTEAYLVSGITVASGPLVGMVPNPVVGQEPAFAPAFVTFEKLRLEGDEVENTCEKYLNLMEQLVECFKQTERSAAK